MILFLTFLSILPLFPQIFCNNFGESFLYCFIIIVSIILIQIIFITSYKLQSLLTTIFDKYCYCCIAYVFMIVFVNNIVFSNANTMTNEQIKSNIINQLRNNNNSFNIHYALLRLKSNRSIIAVIGIKLFTGKQW